MDQFLASLPKRVLATGAIILGIAFIVLSDPPRGLCDTQLEIFKENQKGFLYLKKGQSAVVDASTGTKRKSQFEASLFDCKRSNNQGGCLEFFLKLRDFKGDIKEVSQECHGELGEISTVKNAIWSSLDLMVQMAWGEKPPEGQFDKTGWFEPPELHMYCAYKDLALMLYGNESWTQKREAWMKSMPGADKLPRNEVWERILLSVDCRKF